LPIVVCFASFADQDIPASGQSGRYIPFTELGAKASAQYQGDGIQLQATPRGATLRCLFQKLEGEATTDGLWLTSTVDGTRADRFRVLATFVGRALEDSADPQAHGGDMFPSSPPHERFQTRAGRHDGSASDDPAHGVPTDFAAIRTMLNYTHVDAKALPRTGTAGVVGELARFIRPGFVEEYSVSADGIQQDFLLLQRPAGDGKLRVELEVTGAEAVSLANGARLVLNGSGRKIAYDRLRVTDARARELSAKIEVVATNRLAVLVDDLSATYPIRIDPTFSDANWMSMGGIPGANGTVRAAAVDGWGNLYIGGDFTLVGNVYVNRIAKWDGSSWTGLGSGVSSSVYALAISGGDLYAGGLFTTAGGSPAPYIAKWDGSSWTALGAGINDLVYALAVSGNELYAGGRFTTAGGNAANRIAKWDGNSWSALGAGMDAWPYALAVSGSNLYAGGVFTTAGGNAARHIAKWDGSNWSAVGSGMNNNVNALAVSGSNLYAGGNFTTAGGVPANYIAKWDESSWTGLGSGMNSYVNALAFSGTDLCAGGWFTAAGGGAANGIAKWDGSGWAGLVSGLNGTVNALATSGTNIYAGGSFGPSDSSAANIARWGGSNWTALGFGLNSPVYALAVSDTNMYAGGAFTGAGSNAANHIAKWDGSNWTVLGSGLNKAVLALAVSGSELYAGGSFTAAGSTVANLCRQVGR